MVCLYWYFVYELGRSGLECCFYHCFGGFLGIFVRSTLDQEHVFDLWSLKFHTGLDCRLELLR